MSERQNSGDLIHVAARTDGVSGPTSEIDHANSASPVSGVDLAPDTDGHSNYEARAEPDMYDTQGYAAVAGNHTASAVSTIREIDPPPSGTRFRHVDLAPIIVDIIAEHTRRQAAIKMQRRLDQSASAMARRLCGWRVDLDEKERTRLNKRAEDIVARLEKHEQVNVEDGVIADQLLPFVMATMASRAPFDQLRKNAEKTMASRARELPVWPWVSAIRGVDAGGLAAIVGEAGNLSNYATVARLWKRLGLAVLDGKRQGNPGKTATAEDWIAHGYSGRRRSVVWNVGHALVMTNKDGVYREIYLARKAYETARAPDMTKGQAANRAQRYMEKRFIRDLWVAWRKADGTYQEPPPPRQEIAA